jgi:hypothetical protein
MNPWHAEVPPLPDVWHSPLPSTWLQSHSAAVVVASENRASASSARLGSKKG